MGTEIERKFLVRADRWAEPSTPGTHLRQGYLSEDSARTVRLRVAGQQAWLTVKGQTTGVARAEFEYPVPAADAEEMLDTLALSGLAKTRHRVRVGEHTWDVDVFHGPLQGLILAEVELSDPDETFERPAWLGEEVSSDPRYYNSALARAGAPPQPR